MNSGSLFGNLLVKLGLASAKPMKKHSENSAAPPTYKPTAADLAAFERRLGNVLGRQFREAEDNVFVIDLSNCRRRLGSRWGALSDKIHARVTAILDSRLTRQELYLRRDEDSYLVVFAGATPRNAQIRSLVITQAIAERLTGQDQIGDAIEVKSLSFDPLGRVHLDELPAAEEVLDFVPEATTWSKPRKPSAKIRAVERKPADLRDVKIIYRPMLAVRAKVMSTFMCLPIRKAYDNFHISGYDVLGPGALPEDYAALDQAALREAGSYLRSLAGATSKSLIGISVHYETLASRHRLDYTAQCSKLIGHQSSRIIFEMVGLPAGIPEVRLMDLMSALHLNARAIIVRFTADHKDFVPFQAAGVHAVGLDLYQNRTSEQTLFQDLDAFARKAEKFGIKTYLSGVRSLSIYTAAIAAGFDYAAGHALTSTVETPEKAYVYRMETPYLSLLETPATPAGKGDSPP